MRNNKNGVQQADLGNQAVTHRLFMLLHTWAGLLIAPFILLAAFTGLIYVFSPQIDAYLHADLDTVVPGSVRQSLDRQVGAAQATRPDLQLHFVVPAYRAAETTQVFLRGHSHHGAMHDHGLSQDEIVYVNPYTAHVVGMAGEMSRFRNWSRKLHSSLLQGNGWRWLIELAASWMLVFMFTGLYLVWMRFRVQQRSIWQLFVPCSSSGRRGWREWHGKLPLLLFPVLLIIVVTGLTWSQQSGDKFRHLQQDLHQGSPKFPKNIATVAAGVPLSMQAVYAQALQLAPAIQMQLTPPKSPADVWRIESYDRSQPTKRFLLALDASNGKPRFQSGWHDYPLLAKATAVGIPFHRGDFGWWNQLLLAAVAVLVMFSVLSAYVMWWQRPAGQHWQFAAMPIRHWRALPLWLWLLLPMLAYAMPVLGISLLILALLEWVRIRVINKNLHGREAEQ